MRTRTLDWEALRNARDLGGLALDDGGETRFGGVARSETLRQLTPVGWDALAAYGVATVLDLRFGFEIENDRPLDAGPLGPLDPSAPPAPPRDGHAVQFATVAISLFGEPDPRVAEHFDAISRAQPDEVASIRAVYLEVLALYRPHLARAVAAVADAEPEGCLLVHCHAGKDRTGLVVALLLAVAGVSPEAIAADYALSGRNLADSLASWVEGGADPESREHRRRISVAPQQAMLDVLGELASRYDGAASYLRDAGLSESHLDRVRMRLV